ncbi:putative 4-hydroxyphenylpyruvate dioxygenase [Iris pallida]|uniref:4-hydroxyphenylpyruvate dioxygenase n=1 Tax=Iris pallida TaxID=29817 RepID=A0AAX6GRS5_IRIPA|nr:putative 4-hydroxyphenylpyruvate dioxygenase [Iris pallida]
MAFSSEPELEENNSHSSSFSGLVGYSKFVRSNPRSDRFPVHSFHHVEFWCSDATSAASRFSFGLGMPIRSRSDLSTGNSLHCSFLLRSHSLRFLFTAPYPSFIPNSNPSIPSFHPETSRSFVSHHGLAVRAVAVAVSSAEQAFNASVSNGAVAVFPPTDLGDGFSLAEVQLYGERRPPLRHREPQLRPYLPPRLRRRARPRSPRRRRIRAAPPRPCRRQRREPGARAVVRGEVHWVPRVRGVHRGRRGDRGERAELGGAGEQLGDGAPPAERAGARDQEEEPDTDVPGPQRRSGSAAPGAVDGRRHRDAEEDEGGEQDGRVRLHAGAAAKLLRRGEEEGRGRAHGRADQRMPGAGDSGGQGRSGGAHADLHQAGRRQVTHSLTLG